MVAPPWISYKITPQRHIKSEYWLNLGHDSLLKSCRNSTYTPFGRTLKMAKMQICFFYLQDLKTAKQNS